MKKIDPDVIYLRRAQSKYMVDDYDGALNDFEKINNSSNFAA